MSLDDNKKNITLAKNLRKNDTSFRGVCAYIDAVVKAFLREEGGPR